MKFILTSDYIDGNTRIYDIDQKEFMTFPDVVDQIYEPKPMNELWQYLPNELILKIIRITVNECMFECSEEYVLQYIYLSRSILTQFSKDWFGVVKNKNNFKNSILAVNRVLYFAFIVIDVLQSTIHSSINTICGLRW